MELISVHEIKLHENFDNFVSLDDLSKKEQSINRTLGDSILNMGLVNPLLVQKINGSTYLIDGYKRLRIIKELIKIKKEVPAIQDGKVCVEFIPTELDPKVARFVCTARENPGYTSNALIMDDLLQKFGASKIELAHNTGQKLYFLSRYSRYNKMIPEVNKAIECNKIPMSATKYFILFTAEGQKKLYKNVKKHKVITKSLVEKLAYKMPEKYYITPEDKRKEKSKLGAGHVSKQKPIFDSKMEKRILSEKLSDKVAERDILFKERERIILNLEKIVGMFELALRYTNIKTYLQKNHNKIFEGIGFILKQELNLDIS